MGITVENGGILTTVQDEGRFGNQAFGVSTSGAMDPRAFHIANLLVGNKKTEGALEMTFIGPTLTFTSDNIIAVTGGDLTPMLDGQPFPMRMDVQVMKDGTSQGGVTLHFSRMQTDVPVKMDFSIPSKYKRITLSQIIKSLSSNKM